VGFVLEKRREKVNSGEEYFQQLQTLAFAVFLWQFFPPACNEK